MGIVLAFIGIALLTGGSFVASALGVGITGGATIGAMKKKPDRFGLYIALSALGSSQGLYGFVGFMLLQKFLVPEITMFQGMAILGVGLMVAFVAIYANLKQADICASGIKAIAEGHNVFASTMVLAVFPEFFAILSLLVVIIVAGII